MQTYYEVLGVSEVADQATIRSTYLRLLQIYHPDHNSDAAAGRKTAEIIEAYATLSDPAKRREYDKSLRPASAPHGTTQTPKNDQKGTPAQEIFCGGCNVQDATLRLSVMYWVVSLIVVTRRGGRAGIWCQRCRAKQALLWTSVAGFLGWWGFPWGPIYTLHALYVNGTGGIGDREKNAALLRLVSYQLFQKERLSEALAAIVESLALQVDEPSSRFAQSLREVGVTPPVRMKKTAYRALTAAPGLAVIVIVALGFTRLVLQPTGYVTRYEAPRTLPGSPPAEGLLHSTTSNRAKVNQLVDSMATLVEEHATWKGRRTQGTTTTNEYVLDRAKYEAEPFGRIAAQLRPYLADKEADGDGFASSAYFNAMIMALSIAIENGMEAGNDIRSAIREVYDLRSDVDKGGWLAASTTLEAYRELTRKLRILEKYYDGMGVDSAHSQEEELKDLKAILLNQENQIKRARAAGDSDLAHQIAELHDQKVDRYNILVKHHNQFVAARTGLDLAFNRCLDPGILMTKFQHVDLLSDAETPSSLP